MISSRPPRQVVQEPGEIIFIPPYWHHQVENLTSALSINHNWLNAAGLHWTWAQLRADARECAEQIEDCRPLCTAAEYQARELLLLPLLLSVKGRLGKPVPQFPALACFLAID